MNKIPFGSPFVKNNFQKVAKTPPPPTPTQSNNHQNSNGNIVNSQSQNNNSQNNPNMGVVAQKYIENYSYIMTQEIGQGFESKVFKGNDERNGQPVAIKVIDRKKPLNQVQEHLLSNEISVLKKLRDNPNILNFKDVFYTKNNTYIITQLCDQGDLQKMIRSYNNQIPEQLAVGILKQIVNGFKEMVKHQIVHRDLKPSNILIKDNIMKIADLGFSKDLSAEQVQIYYNVGSPMYMCPQSIIENKYSYKSDIWSIGILFYELLTGTQPWVAMTEFDLVEAIQNKPIKFPQEIFFSQECRHFIQRCLTLNQNDRMGENEIDLHPLFQLYQKKSPSPPPIPSNNVQTEKDIVKVERQNQTNYVSASQKDDLNQISPTKNTFSNGSFMENNLDDVKGEKTGKMEKIVGIISQGGAGSKSPLSYNIKPVSSPRMGKANDELKPTEQPEISGGQKAIGSQFEKSPQFGKSPATETKQPQTQQSQKKSNETKPNHHSFDSGDLTEIFNTVVERQILNPTIYNNQKANFQLDFEKLNNQPVNQTTTSEIKDFGQLKQSSPKVNLPIKLYLEGGEVQVKNPNNQKNSNNNVRKGNNINDNYYTNKDLTENKISNPISPISKEFQDSVFNSKPTDDEYNSMNSRQNAEDKQKQQSSSVVKQEKSVYQSDFKSDRASSSQQNLKLYQPPQLNQSLEKSQESPKKLMLPTSPNSLLNQKLVQVIEKYKEKSNHSNEKPIIGNFQAKSQLEVFKDNQTAIIGQLNFCRFLFKVAQLTEDYAFIDTPHLQNQVLFLSIKNIMIQITKLFDMITSASNLFGLAQWEYYIKTKEYNSMCSVIQQYHIKYKIYFDNHWNNIFSNTSISQELCVDQKFDALFDRNYVEFESFYIILQSFVRYSIREMNHLLRTKIKEGEELDQQTENAIVLLDYLVTYFQLCTLIQSTFTHALQFALQSKIEQIVEGQPVKITKFHFNQLRNQIYTLDI